VELIRNVSSALPSALETYDQIIATTKLVVEPNPLIVVPFGQFESRVYPEFFIDGQELNPVAM
jgi:hypothetical protein